MIYETIPCNPVTNSHGNEPNMGKKTAFLGFEVNFYVTIKILMCVNEFCVNLKWNCSFYSDYFCKRCCRSGKILQQQFPLVFIACSKGSRYKLGWGLGYSVFYFPPYSCLM